MLTGKRYKLIMSSRAIETVNGKPVPLKVPAGALIEVVSSPRDGDRMIDVLWEGRRVAMYAVDMTAHGSEITD